MTPKEKILDIIQKQLKRNLSYWEYCIIYEFIDKCSLSEFEKLKDLEYDLSDNKD
jgi:hypothetical protein